MAKVLSDVDVQGGTLTVQGAKVPVFVYYTGTAWPARPDTTQPVFWISTTAGVANPPGAISGDLAYIG